MLSRGRGALALTLRVVVLLHTCLLLARGEYSLSTTLIDDITLDTTQLIL